MLKINLGHCFCGLFIHHGGKMLTEQRHKLLLELVNKKKSITVTEAKEVLNVQNQLLDVILLHCIMQGS